MATRGLSIEISADTSKFNKSFKEMKKSTSSMKQEVDSLVKSLEMDFDSSKMEKAQKKCQAALDQTSNQANILKQRLKYLEDGGNVDTSEYKKLEAELAKAELTGQKLEKQLQKINSIASSNSIGSKLETVGNQITKVGKGVSILSGATIAGATALGTLATKTAQTGAELDDLSLRFGVSAEKVQEWQYVAMQTGVESEVLSKAFIKARASIADLASGKTNTAVEALNSLGVSMNQFNSNEEMFDGILEALANVKDSTLQAAYANEIFGDKIANQILPYVNTGAEQINALKAEFQSMAYLTNEQVAELAKLDDVLYKVKQSLSYAAMQIGTALAPLLVALGNIIDTNITPKLESLANWINSLSEGQLNMIAKIGMIIAILGPVILLIGKLTTGIGGLIKILPSLNAQLSKLSAHPIIAIIGVIAGILLLLYTRCESFRESINALMSVLGGALTPILQTLMALLQPIIQIISDLAVVLGDTLAPVIDIITACLTPVVEQFSFMMSILQPLISLALIPLQLHFKMLQIPLQAIGALLKSLSPLFTAFSNLVKGVFEGIISWINKALAVVESAINWLIDKVNVVIDGLNMIPGVNISRLDKVSLQIGGSVSDDDIESRAAEATNEYVYDYVDTSNVANTTNNYDYSTNNTTQNVTVTIENYAAEVNTDALVNEINLKLRGLMY